MRRFTVILLMLLLSGGSRFCRIVAAPQEGAPGEREIGRTTEKELKVVLSSSFGTLSISRGEPEKMVIVESPHHPSGPNRVDLDYAIRNRIGYMDVTLGEETRDEQNGRGSFRISDFRAGRWNLRFTDAVPISFDIELGVGKGNFDLSGLQIKDFNLSTGASEVRLSFGEPNKSSIENLNIESGVSKFSAMNLGNANFKRFKFQGGVGAYTLDFGGELDNEVDVDLEVGLGVLTVVIPKDVGARVTYQKTWASRIDCADDFHSSGDNELISDNYYDATGKMNIRIDSGLGSVRVRRR